MRRLLLLSNSTNFGMDYLEHAREAILGFLGPISRILFIPFAIHDRAGYTETVRHRLAAWGIEISGLSRDEEGTRQIEEAPAVFAGGGNTFRLLDALQRAGHLAILRRRALEGMPYLGASAGTNIAAPTIRTTNDMPIVEPGSFEAMGLVPFQINPHYLDADPASRHMGETREQRLKEFLEENDGTVVGLREGAWLRIEGNHVWLEGGSGARVFTRGRPPSEHPPGSRLDSLVGSA